MVVARLVDRPYRSGPLSGTRGIASPVGGLPRSSLVKEIFERELNVVVPGQLLFQLCLLVFAFAARYTGRSFGYLTPLRGGKISCELEQSRR